MQLSEESVSREANKGQPSRLPCHGQRCCLLDTETLGDTASPPHIEHLLLVVCLFPKRWTTHSRCPMQLVVRAQSRREALRSTKSCPAISLSLLRFLFSFPCALEAVCVVCYGAYTPVCGHDTLARHCLDARRYDRYEV